MRVVSNNDGSDHVFSAISKEEVQPISAFLQSKNVRLKNEMEEAMEVDAISDEDMDDDDDDVSIPSEDERGRKVKDKGKKPKASGDDDDDESGRSYELTRGYADWQKTKISNLVVRTVVRRVNQIQTPSRGQNPMRLTQ